MRLTHLAIIAIKGLGREMTKKIAKAIGVSEPTAYKYIRENAPELTMASALQVIKQETGLSDDQILESETADTNAA